MNHEDLIRQNGILLKFLLPENRTYEICYVAVENNPKAIKYVPIHQVDDAIMDMVFEAGESFIRLIPRELLTEYASATIKHQYPDIAIQMGIAPFIVDGSEEREYLEDSYFDCLFNSGQHVLERIPVEFLNKYAVKKIKDSYPKLACEMDLYDVVLDDESMKTYNQALQIIFEEAKN